MALRAVFFDLDGTLLDTSLDLANALNHLRREHGLDAIDYPIVRRQVSNGATALIKLGFGEISDAVLQPLRQRLLELYLQHIAVHSRPFPGIEELIQQLSDTGIAWGIVTNKPELYTTALMRHFTFASPPCATVSPDQVGVGKPNPAVLLHACGIAGCAPGEAIYVGDHLRDIECGRNAGMQTIAVGYGFTQDPNEYLTWNADHAAATAYELWPIISTYSKTYARI